MIRLSRPADSLPPVSALAGGVISILTQGMVLRTALFGQHMGELASGLVLASWLVGSGIGAALAGRFDRPRTVWVTGMLALPFLGLLSLHGVQWVIPFPLSVFPAGFVAGAVFVTPFSSSGVSRVYVLEAIGACLGGAAFLFLSPELLPFMFSLTAFAAASFGILLVRARIPGYIGLVLIPILLLSGAADVVERRILLSSWEEYGEAEAYPSPYGEIVITQRWGQYAVYRSGILETSWPSIEPAEERMTIPLLVVLPERVLYIGSSPEELAVLEKWPGLRTLEAIVPDRVLLEVVDGFPDGSSHGDGRAFLSKAGSLYDLIIVSTGYPLTLLANRFYTREFFESACGRLENGGAVAVFLEGGENRLTPLEADLVGSVLLAGTGSSEWQAVLPTGGVTLMFGRGEEPCTEAGFLADRLDSLAVRMVYMTPGTVLFELAELRTGALEQQVSSGNPKPNADLYPEAFRLASAIWDIRMGADSRDNLLLVAGLLIAAVLIVISAWVSGKPPVVLSLASTGLSGLAVETMAILGVQATLGYSWTMVGAITGIFMAGSAVGAWIASRWSERALLRAQVVSACCAALCALAGYVYSEGYSGPAVFASVLLLLLLPAGASGGAAFVGAVMMSERGKRIVGIVSLAGYAGSAAGALLIPLLLFPLTGAVFGMIFVACATVISAPLLGASIKRLRTTGPG
jgi:spermidine synthase